VLPSQPWSPEESSDDPSHPSEFASPASSDSPPADPSHPPEPWLSSFPGEHPHDNVPSGWTIATLLPLLNTSVAPGLERWDPDRWTRHHLTEKDALPSPMLVTAFGHGRHSCPAQPFSLAAMTAAMTHLLREYLMTPHWTSHPQPVGAQIGGVARAAGVCRLVAPPSMTSIRS